MGEKTNWKKNSWNGRGEDRTRRRRMRSRR
jgi:hypothetical protein